MEYFTLNDGNRIPALGMGTFPMRGFQLTRALLSASKQGYELIDTSAAYGNEIAIGIALRLSFRKRSSFFITSKISNRDRREMSTEQALRGTLRRLGVKYLDLYLIHWPMEGFEQTWLDMVELREKGLIRSVGVANFHRHHLEALKKVSGVLPAVDQVELHPLLSQKPLAAFCMEQNIRMEAYSPVARMHPKLIGDPTLVKLAAKYSKTVPQIIFRWNFQNGIISIPKSASAARLKENISVFDFAISADDMRAIDEVNCDFRVRFDPDNADFSRL